MGKRNLEAALKAYAERHPDEGEPAVRWLPFQLNPDLPAEGIPRAEYVRRKFGSAGNTYARVKAAGKAVGIDFAFDAIEVQPNTVNTHRLMLYGTQHGRTDEVAESVFRAYFTEGANLTDLATLAAIGERAGLARPALEAWLASDDGRDAVLAGDIEARDAGIGGVPFFIFNRKVGLSGAHPPETLLAAMEQALESTE